MVIGGVMHLACLPTELPALLEELDKDYKSYRVTSCVYDDTDHKLHLVVIR
jgi:hypothetical protein